MRKKECITNPISETHLLLNQETSAKTRKKLPPTLRGPNLKIKKKKKRAKVRRFPEMQFSPSLN